MQGGFDMANLKSATKRVRQNEKVEERQQSQRSRMKSAVKRFETAAGEKADNLEELHDNAIQSIDKAYSKGLIHQNKANRQKSRVSKLFNDAN